MKKYTYYIVDSNDVYISDAPSRKEARELKRIFTANPLPLDALPLKIVRYELVCKKVIR